MAENLEISTEKIKRKLYENINADDNIQEDSNEREGFGKATLSEETHILSKEESKNRTKREMDLKNNDFIETVKRKHNNTLWYLHKEYNIEIWKKSLENTYYYRINPFSRKIKVASNDEFLKLVDEHIKVYENIKDVHLEKDVLILVKSLILDIKDEVFYPHESQEFFKLNNIEYRNTFQYSDFLYKRVLRRQKRVDENYIIEDYIYNMFQSKKEADYVIAWLSFYFQTLNKSSTAIILIGDKETTDIFINQIIRPVFAYKKEYFGCINNEILKESNKSILKDKIFYHVDDLSKENLNDKKTSRIVLDILKRNRFTCDEAIELEEDYIYGQLIVTSSKDTPYPLLKDCYSRCSVFKVKSLEKILENMKFDRFILEDEISYGLDYFSKTLFQKNTKWYEDKYFPYNPFETEEKEVLPNMKNGVLRTKRLEDEIEKFISSIQQKNINYFKNLQTEIFEELKKNFEDNMIAQPLLSIYFNRINGDEIFPDNSYFLEILKEKHEMFKKAPTDKSKFNGKKRYEIKNFNSTKNIGSLYGKQ